MGKSLHQTNLDFLKSYFRTKVKELHPDRGGDKEAYLKFLEWYKNSLKDLKGGPFIKVLKNGYPSGEGIYRVETFTIKEVALGLTKKLELPLREEVCPECLGKGKNLSGKKSLCKFCNGEGFLFLKKNGSAERAKCPFCKGKGYVYHEFCPRCLGKGVLKINEVIEIKLPYGLREGDILFISGKPFGLNYDFYLEVFIEPHPFFRFEGKDILCEPEVPFYEILLKDYIVIETLEGPEEIPTYPLRKGEPIIFPGRGPYLSEENFWERADLIIKPRIIFPERIPEEGKHLIEKLIEIMKENEGGNHERKSS